MTTFHHQCLRFSVVQTLLRRNVRPSMNSVKNMEYVTHTMGRFDQSPELYVVNGPQEEQTIEAALVRHSYQ